MITQKNQPSFIRPTSLFKLFLGFILSLSLFLSFLSFVYAGGPGVSDAEIKTIRQQFFKEIEHGVPGISSDDINEDFVGRLYGIPNALGALDRILAGDDYVHLNNKIGQVRGKAVLESWAEVIGETRIRVELNNAGKQNGARSDQDLFMYTDAQELYNDEGLNVPLDQIHSYLIKKFRNKFSRRMKGRTPEQFDVMIFPGDGMMMDWRMSKTSWRSFMARINTDISDLSATEGAYFIPAAYKNQVYTRYLDEGRTTIIEGVSDGRPFKPEGLDIPDGVRISADLSTREASLRYAGVPGQIDRNAALGVVLQNVIQTRSSTISTLKRSKYSNRWINGYAQTTNLEKNYQLLLLEGRDGARKRFAKKLFDEFEAEDRLPPNIKSPEALQRVLDLMNRIEIDKIIGDAEPGTRPGNWSDYYQNYQKQNIVDAETKLKYFAQEAQEFKQAMRAASPYGYDLDDAKLADHAEMMFMDKARQAARMAAGSAARKTLKEVFSRGGAARQRWLHGADAAARQIVERMKGLHAAFVFLEDEAMIRSIVAEAPPEARQAVDDIVKIARAQRKDILEKKSAVEDVTKGQLEESDDIVRKLVRDLGFDDDDTRRPPPPGVDENYVHRRIVTEMSDAISKVGQHNRERVYQFLAHELPEFTTVQGFTSGYWENIADIGTVNSLGKVTEAWLTGDKKRAYSEIMNTLAESVPIGGKIFSLGKNLKAYQEGQTSPTAMFLVNQVLGAVPGGAKYSAMTGWVMAVYGLEQSLYKIGWHFIGKPAQSDAISLILMGRMNAIPIAQTTGESAMPMMNNDEDWRRVKENAILVKKVPIPENLRKSKDMREAVLRSHFMSHATRKTAAAGGGAQLREDTLKRDYYAHWEYWLRRLYFYEAVHKEVWKTVTPGKMKLDASAPYFINSENRGEYLAATIMGKGGKLLWNHEEAWLRYHFRNHTVEAWISSQREFGEVMNWLRDDWLKRTFFTGSWEKMVVDELVKYYREGEFLALARDANQADLEKQQAKARSRLEQGKLDGAMKFVKRANKGTQAIIYTLLVKERHKSIERLKTLETLYWHPQTVSRFESAMESAVRSHGDYTPDENDTPRLKVKIPRPVCRPGWSMPIEFKVRGNVKLVPDAKDLDYTVNYKKIGEVEGTLPKEVLKDDIITLFGKDVSPEKLRVIKQEVTVKVTSLDNPEFNVAPVKKIVFCVTYRDKEDEEEQEQEDQEEPFDFSEAERLLEELRMTAASAEGKEAETKNKCAEADAKNSTTDASTQDFQSHLNNLDVCLKNLITNLEKSNTDLSDAGVKKDEAFRLTQKIAQIRVRMGALSEQVCEKTDAIKENLKSGGTDKDRRALMAEAQQFMDQLKTEYAAAKDAYARIKDSVKKVVVIANRVNKAEERTRKAEETFADFDAPLSRIQGFIQDYKQSVKGAKDAYMAVKQLHARGKGLYSKGSGILNPINENSETARELLRQMNGYLGQITVSEINARDCPDQAEAELKSIEKKLTALQEITASLKQNHAQFRSSVQGRRLGWRANEILDNVWATETVADALWESLEDYRVAAAFCIVLGQDLTTGKLKIKVPSVKHLTIESARSKLGGAGLDVAVAKAGQAPSADLANKVAVQTPEAGSEVESGHTVTIKVYGGMETVQVPGVVAMSAGQAQGVLTAVGLVPVIVGGDPAPAEFLKYTVQSQSPTAGQTVSGGATVTIVVYGDYELISVPSVVGLSADEAKGTISGAGLSPAFVGGDPAPEEYLKHTVHSQSPSAGQKYPPGTTVTIVIYGDTDLVQVPNVVGLSAKVAQSVISGARLNITIVGGDPAPSPLLKYTVQSQTPVAGQDVTSGTTVTAIIYGDVDSIQVPNVVGMSAQDAQSVIAGAGLSASPVGGDSAPSYRLRYKVQSQSPQAGEAVAQGETVTIRIYGDYEKEPETPPDWEREPVADEAPETQSCIVGVWDTSTGIYIRIRKTDEGTYTGVIHKLVLEPRVQKYFLMKVGDKIMNLIRKGPNTFKVTVYAKLKDGTITSAGGSTAVLKGDTVHAGGVVWKRVK